MAAGEPTSIATRCSTCGATTSARGGIEHAVHVLRADVLTRLGEPPEGRL